jgi:N-acetylglucosaminyldiphosphoundecaprenol N-acetyl-beta-D-mannosaminyltransferase
MVALCQRWAQERREGRNLQSHYVCVTSAHGVILADDDAVFASYINTADAATPDGMPVVWALRSFGEKQQQRVYGPTLMHHLCDASANHGIRIFLYGSSEETLQTLRANLIARFPGLQIAGSYSPPFRPLTAEEDSQICVTIGESNVDILFVGLSTPKQEKWMYEHRHSFPGTTMIGVGAAFDFHAGATRQAPLWIQNNGLEWLFRLLMEPARLWRRYLLITPRFLPLWFGQLLKNRAKPN